MTEPNYLRIGYIAPRFAVFVSEPFMKALDRETRCSQLGCYRFGCKTFIQK